MPKWLCRENDGARPRGGRQESAHPASGVQGGGDSAQVDGHLAQELVGPEAVVVPDGHLEDSGAQVLGTQ